MANDLKKDERVEHRTTRRRGTVTDFWTRKGSGRTLKIAFDDGKSEFCYPSELRRVEQTA